MGMTHLTDNVPLAEVWRRDRRTISMPADEFVTVRPPSWRPMNCHRMVTIGQLGRGQFCHTAAMATKTIPEYLEDERRSREETQLRTDEEAARIQSLRQGHHRTRKQPEPELPAPVEVVVKAKKPAVAKARKPAAAKVRKPAAAKARKPTKAKVRKPAVAKARRRVAAKTTKP